MRGEIFEAIALICQLQEMSNNDKMYCSCWLNVFLAY